MGNKRNERFSNNNGKIKFKGLGKRLWRDVFFDLSPDPALPPPVAGVNHRVQSSQSSVVSLLRGGVSVLLCTLSVCSSKDVSVHVPPRLHGEGGGPPLHQGLLLGAAGDPGVRRHRLPADAPGRGGADPQPLWERHKPGDGGAPAPALGERAAVDGAVLHRGVGPGERRARGTGEPYFTCTALWHILHPLESLIIVFVFTKQCVVKDFKPMFLWDPCGLQWLTGVLLSVSWLKVFSELTCMLLPLLLDCIDPKGGDMEAACEI